MSALFSFPALDDVSDTLSLLLNKQVSVTQGSPITTSPTIVGTYIDQQGNVGALGLVDLPLASYTGAALTMIPTDTAASNIRSGKLSDEIRENLQEVFNIMVAFFNQGNVPHIRYHQLHTSPPEFPGDINALLNAAGQRADIEVDIQGYGAGKMSLYAV